jgi:hypothetical protein
MAEPLSSLFRPTAAARLPAFEHLPAPAAENVLAAELAARTAAGDVVIDLCGRGGLVARAAIGALRRALVYESIPLTRLLAEVVLRPPDVRHLDAAVASLARYPRGEADLRRTLDEPFSSRCPNCGRPVVVDEFIWQTDSAPSSKVFRCHFCRDQRGVRELRTAPVDDDDLARARAMALPDDVRANLRRRFATPAEDDQLPDELLSLFTPRTLVALDQLTARLDADERESAVGMALRLGLVSALISLSRLNRDGGRVASLRIVRGHLRQPRQGAWRERNPWLAVEEGWRSVRAFIGRLEAGPAAFQPRPGDDLGALLEGTANVVLRDGPAWLAANAPVLPAGAARRGRLAPRARVRLVLTSPPIQWTTESLSWAYLTSAIVLGHEAAAAIALDGLFGEPPRADHGRVATDLRRALSAIKPVLADDARIVVVLDRGGPANLAAGVLGGIGAGFRLSATLLAESGRQIGGLLEFSTREASESVPAPFDLDEISAAISDVAASVLQARGEPATAERLLGEVLIGLDRLGHLDRLAATQTFSESADAAESGGRDDHVDLLIDLLMSELRRPDHPRLVELEPGSWWLRQPADIAQARPPLADRLEWAVFGLMSTSRHLDEATFLERVARMFGGYDAPDEELVRTTLDSYRDPAAPPAVIVARDSLPDRHAEHGVLVGMLVEYGHRLGLRCWTSPHEQRRTYRDGTVGDLLTDEEKRVYLPLVAHGDLATLESTDCIWYLRGKATFLFEVEWTAMLAEPLLRRASRIPASDTLVRFLVIPPERAELVRLKLARSPLLRAAMTQGNWHILKSNHLRALFAQENAGIERLAPVLGLDPAAERPADQLALFG